MKFHFLQFLVASCLVFLVSCSQTPKPTPYPYSTTYYQPSTVAPVPAPSFFRPSSAPPAINAAAYILIDANTGRTLASRNADMTRGVASTQKLVTALVVTKSGNLERNVRVEASDLRVEPTKLGLKVGEIISRRNLLHAFLVKSGNDGANALARDNAGSQRAFAARMNSLARYYGATRSSFVNPHGLTASGQYSTARDMAKIAMVAFRDPVIRDIVKRRYIIFHGRSMKNTNDLLGRMADCNGMKTGYTNAAGRCLISSATRGGKSVILVQLGTKTKYIWDDGQALMSWGLANL